MIMLLSVARKFAHLLFMVDRLGHDKSHWIVVLAKYPFISKNKRPKGLNADAFFLSLQ